MNPDPHVVGYTVLLLVGALLLLAWLSFPATSPVVLTLLAGWVLVAAWYAR